MNLEISLTRLTLPLILFQGRILKIDQQNIRYAMKQQQRAPNLEDFDFLFPTRFHDNIIHN